MIRCRRAAELISRGLDAPLSAGRRLAVWVHTAVCGKCRRYGRQVALLDDAAADLFARPVPGDGRLSPAARDRIARRLAAAHRSPDSAGDL